MKQLQAGKRRQLRWVVILSVLVVFTALGCLGPFRGKTVSAASTGPAFVEFESGPVRPIVLSADGNTLFAVNTPDGTLI
jgi:flagellar basal body-associated protein FliL